MQKSDPLTPVGGGNQLRAGFITKGKSILYRKESLTVGTADGRAAA